MQGKKSTESPAFMTREAHGVEIVKELAPHAGDYRIVKPRIQLFFGTVLELILKRLGIEGLVICGTQYPNCIRATAFDGLSLGSSATVITDATSALSSGGCRRRIRLGTWPGAR